MCVEGGTGGRGEEPGANCVAQKHTDTSLMGVGKVGCHRGRGVGVEKASGVSHSGRYSQSEWGSAGNTNAPGH